MFVSVMNHVSEFLEPWKSAYSDSTLLSTSVTAAHMVALLFSGGLAVAADRTTLLAGREGAAERARQLVQLHGVHRPVLIAIAVLFVSGVVMTAADFDVFVNSPVFWIKMGLIALLLVNGAILVSIESRLRAAATNDGTVFGPARLWHRLRVGTWCSVALWTATLLAGVVLVNTA